MIKKALTPLINLVLFGVLIVLVTLFTSAYISKECYFYYWDYALYQQITNDQVYASQSSPLEPLRSAFASLGDDYNKLFTLPLIPILNLIGHSSSRISYIQSLAIVYLFPYFIIIGFIARKIFPSPSYIIFWVSILVAFLTPTAWLPTLRGYPDPGGAFLVLLATWAYLYDTQLRKWWQILLIGISLACAILFRRHFVYGASALILSMAAVDFTDLVNGLRHRCKEAVRIFIKDILRLILVVMVCLAILLTIGNSFIHTVLQKNSQLFYSSWQIDPLRVFQNFQDYYGWAGIVVAFIGIISGLIYLPQFRKNITLAVIIGSISTVQWIFWVRQFNPQYSLYITPFILLGLITLTVLICKYPHPILRWAGKFALTFYFIINAFIGISPRVLDNPEFIKPLFASQTAPLQLEGYDQIVLLVHTLHQIVTKRETVAVVASSGIINSDLIKAADRSIFPSQPIKFIFTPEIDTRDSYPIEIFLQAKYILIAKPIQIHLAPSEHDVLRAVYQAFIEGWEISNEYLLLPESIHLTENVQIYIYQRIQEIEPGLAIRTLSKIQDFIGDRPPNQPDWIRLNSFSSNIVNNHPEGFKIKLNLSQPTNFIYIGNIPSSGILSGSMLVKDDPCGKVILQLASGSAEGNMIPFDTLSFLPGVDQPLSIKFQKQNTKFIVLTLSRENYEAENCQIVLKHIKMISSTP